MLTVASPCERAFSSDHERYERDRGVPGAYARRLVPLE